MGNSWKWIIFLGEKWKGVVFHDTLGCEGICMERNVAVWGGEGRSLMRRVVWRLEGEKYKKYAHWDVVFQKTLVNFLLSVPALCSRLLYIIYNSKTNGRKSPFLMLSQIDNFRIPISLLIRDLCMY